MFDVVLVLVVTAHLMAVAWAVAGPFVGMWLAWRQRLCDDTAAAVAGKYVLGLSLVALAAAIVLGLAALGLLWWQFRHPYFDAAAQVPPRRYGFGLVELMFSLVCLSAAWKWSPPVGAAEGAARFWTRWSLVLLAATNLTYHFPPLFTVIGVYCTRPQRWGDPLPFTTMLVDPEVIARTIHYLLAAFAVTGATLATVTRPFVHAGLPDAARGRVAAWGGRIALAAVVGQLLSGTYLLVEMPAASRELLLGGDSIATAAFAASLLATIALLHSLAAVSLGDSDRRRLRAAVCLVALVMFLMVATRHRTRNQWLSEGEGIGNRGQVTVGGGRRPTNP
ncbi:MAG TPA: hypothetical protein VND64_35760 [Pirellulales bacterium]|nr:hypothetical protein [Pirellulales bacterium]